MKKTIASAFAGFLIAASGIFADVITITPSVPLRNLNPYEAYLWNIDLNHYALGGMGSINSVTLTISGITNTIESRRNDILHVDLLDLATPCESFPNSLRLFDDNRIPTDFFGSAKPRLGWTAISPIGTFSDRNGPRKTDNLSFSIDMALLRSFAGDNGLIGIGIDPDCQYRNRGVKLTINVPEPSSSGLLGLGILLLAPASFAFRRKKE